MNTIGVPLDIRLPLTDEAVASLRAGMTVRLTGPCYTARDAAHKRLVEMLDRGEELPLPLRGQCIYYVGPSPAPEGKPIGAAGPRGDGYSATIICGQLMAANALKDLKEWEGGDK